MPLVICPECGNKVSSFADKCPSCGCPKEYFQQSTEEQIENPIPLEENKNEPVNKEESSPIPKYSFDIYNTRLFYEGKNYPELATLAGSLFCPIEITAQKVIKIYDEAGSISNALNKLSQVAAETLGVLLDNCIEILYKYGVNMSQAEFMQKYKFKDYTIDYQNCYEQVLEKYSSILEEKNSMEKYRAAQQAARGSWSGGGFGIKGAIKGAATAAVLNMGTDFIHSFGDAEARNRDNAEISKKLAQLYNNGETKGLLAVALADSMRGLAFAVLEELSSRNFLPNPNMSRKKAITLYNNTLQFEQAHSEKFIYNMFDCILLYPFERKFYEDILPKTTHLPEFIDFWNMRDLFSDYLLEIDFEKIIDDVIPNDDSTKLTMDYYISLRKRLIEWIIEKKVKKLPNNYRGINDFFTSAYKSSYWNSNGFLDSIPSGLSTTDLFSQIRALRVIHPSLFFNQYCWIYGDGKEANNYPNDKVVKRTLANYTDELLFIVRERDACTGIAFTKNRVYSLNNDNYITYDKLIGAQYDNYLTISSKDLTLEFKKSKILDFLNKISDDDGWELSPMDGKILKEVVQYIVKYGNKIE